MSDFKHQVHEVVKRIAPGKTMSYKEVAAAAGNPGAWRAVGRIMARNYDKSIPCHRVVRSDGKTGGYNRGGVAMKEQLLAQERATGQGANLGALEAMQQGLMGN